MNCKPVKNVHVIEIRLESGCVMLSYPVGTRPWITALIKRFADAPEKPVTKKLELDTLGSAVWDLLDGKRSVKQVIKIFAQKYRLHPKEAETSVTLFLRQLGKRGLVGFRQ
ncbi:MAG: PqqD family protein [Desulfobacterales bacterium]